MKQKIYALLMMVGTVTLLIGGWLFSLNSNTVEAGNLQLDINQDPLGSEGGNVQASTTITLYDGALGGTPDDQSFLYLNLPVGTASNTESGGVTTLDTTLVNMGAYAGYFGDADTVSDFPVLDRTKGYSLTFTIQVEGEAHSSNDRAGFSVIVLSDDNKGIEMAFWEDEIWVQDDDLNDPGDLFTHAEGVAYSTTTALTTYSLAVYSDTYTLTVGMTTILTGRLRDYTNFSGPIDPYETPNFLFFGDNTTSAEGRTRVSYIAVTVVEGDPPVGGELVYMPVVVNP